MPRPAATFAAGLAVVLLLAGCVPPDPIITPEPGPGATPVFASDEEALAAATDAYAKYLKVSDEISADGGSAPERLAPLVTPKQLVTETDAFADLSKSGSTTKGVSAFEVFQLQRYEDLGDGSASVSIYVCLDVGNVRVIDKSGVDVTPSNRVDRVPLEVDFLVKSDRPGTLLVDRSEAWTGQDFCN
ncbi:MAG: hypothetical protein KF739_04880 [Cryobacterium sp.]|nr:hypothetical protein [Cryobacterium sp.]